MGHQGTLKLQLGSILGGSWAILGASYEHFCLKWEPRLPNLVTLGSILAHLGDHVETTKWSPSGTQSTPRCPQDIQLLPTGTPKTPPRYPPRRHSLSLIPIGQTYKNPRVSYIRPQVTRNGSPRDPQAPTWKHLGRILGASWATLGASWTILGGSWDHLEASWGPSCSILGTILVLLGSILGASWTTLGTILEHLGRILGLSLIHI